MISLILGPMFSGKSTELIRRLERSHFAKKRVVLVRPRVDLRDFITHTYIQPAWLPVIKTENLMNVDCSQYDVVGIDEVQFHQCTKLFCYREQPKRNKQIIMSGLQSSSEGEMFDEVVSIIPYCDEIVKLNAVCVKCGSDHGSMTYYKSGGKKEKVKVGDGNEYEARCYSCWHRNEKEE